MSWSAVSLRLRQYWTQQSPAQRLFLSTTATVLALLLFAVIAIGLGGSQAYSSPGIGVAVPTDQLAMINAAANACPSLTPPRLAGQLMANSGFDATSVRAGGGTGIAGLTDAEWKRWAPGPSAQRTSAADNITALAHEMCDLVGAARADKLTGDPWRFALAMFLVGPDAVGRAGGIPPGDAANYVDSVDAYTNWYQEQSQFGGAASDSPAAAAAAVPAALPVPDALVASVVAAGRICPAIAPAQIAAQLMAQSGFNANMLGTAGEEGIAQFRPALWTRYNTDPVATPWDAGPAIVALGHAMCDLTNQASSSAPASTAPSIVDPYASALTAFEWGVTSVAGAGGVPADPSRSLVMQVSTYLAYYAADPRLGTAATTATATPSPHPASTPATHPAITPSPSSRSAYTRIEAESYNDQSGTGLEDCHDDGGGQDVGHLAAGDWLRYNRIDFGASAATTFSVRYAGDLPAGMSAVIQVRLDSPSATPVGGAAIAGTGGWQSWITVPATLSAVTGVHDVYLTFVSSNGWEIGNINWFQFGH